MDYKEDIIRTDVRKNEGTMRSPIASQATRRKVRKSPSPRTKILPTPNAGALTDEVDPVAAYILAWIPRTVSKKDWEPIAPVVKSMVSQAKPKSKPSAVKQLRVLTRVVLTQHKKGHRIDDPAQLLNEETLIAVYGHESARTLAPRSRATDLWTLRAMRKKLLPEIYGKPSALIVARQQITRYYTDEELISLLHWARGGRIALAKRVHVQLVIGIAAGIEGHEIPYLRGTDLLCTPWGLVVKAPGVNRMSHRGPRLVPVLAKYEKELAGLMMGIGDNPILGISPTGSLRKSGDYQIKTAGVPNFNSLQARSTWIRTILAGGASYLAMQQSGANTGGDAALKNLSAGLSLPLDRLITELRMSSRDFDAREYSGLTQWESQL